MDEQRQCIGMNGRISPENWQRMDTDQRLWVIYDTLNTRCSNHWQECEKRMGKAEKLIDALQHRKLLDTTLSSVSGMIGGFMAIIGKALLGK